MFSKSECRFAGIDLQAFMQREVTQFPGGML